MVETPIEVVIVALISTKEEIKAMWSQADEKEDLILSNKLKKWAENLDRVIPWLQSREIGGMRETPKPIQAGESLEAEITCRKDSQVEVRLKGEEDPIIIIDMMPWPTA